MNDKVILKNSNTLLEDDVFFPDKEIIDYGELFLNYSSDKEALFIKNDSNEVISIRSKKYNIDKINKSLPEITYSNNVPEKAKEGDIWIIPIDSSPLVFYTEEPSETVKITNNGSLFNYIEIDGNVIDLSEGEIYYTFNEVGDHIVNVEINESVREVKDIFKDCIRLKRISDGLFNQCHLIYSFESAFENCQMLEEIPLQLFNENTLVQSFRNVFSKCSSLTYIPEDLFKYNVNVVDFSYIFSDCISISSSIPAMLLGNSQHAKYFDYSFFNCENIIGTIPFDIFYLCSEALSFEGCFMNCYSITGELSTNLFSLCRKAENFSKMFENCYSITSIKPGIFNNCINAINFSETFSGCTSLTSFPKYIFSNCTKILDLSYAFKGCLNMFEVSPRDMAFGNELPLYNRNINPGYTAVENYTECFNGCINLTDYADIPSDWR